MYLFLGHAGRLKVTQRAFIRHLGLTNRKETFPGPPILSASAGIEQNYFLGNSEWVRITKGTTKPAAYIHSTKYIL